MFDVSEYVHPQDPWPACEGLSPEQVRRQYLCKHDLALALQPRSILEVGVRAGYSAAAFLAAVPTAAYLGLDSGGDAHGGVPGFPLWARDMLRQRFPHASVTITLLDTQAEADSITDLFDLV